MLVVSKIMSSVEDIVPFADVCGDSQRFKTHTAHQPSIPTLHRQSLWPTMVYVLDSKPLSPAVLLATEPAHISVVSITFIPSGGKKLALFDHNV